MPQTSATQRRQSGTAGADAQQNGPNFFDVVERIGKEKQDQSS